MDIEFINAYIIKQKSFIEDLVAKNIILETKLQLSETKAALLNDELQKISTKVEKQQRKKQPENSGSEF